MTRRKIIAIIFLFWGAVIVISSVWLISAKRRSLLAFSRKVAEEKIFYYPPRSPILDKNGEKVCFTEWIFYVRVSNRRAALLKRLMSDLNIHPSNKYSENDDSASCIIPKEKMTSAVKLCRKYRLQIRKRIIRHCVDLPDTVRYKLGYVLLYSGLNGIEAEYNDHLQGSPGIYLTVRGPQPVNTVEKNSFKILSPMQNGRALYLKQSLIELKCGIMPEVREAAK